MNTNANFILLLLAGASAMASSFAGTSRTTPPLPSSSTTHHWKTADAALSARIKRSRQNATIRRKLPLHSNVGEDEDGHGGAALPSNGYPSEIEKWDNDDVVSWLGDLGFQRYAQGFRTDAQGFAVDGDRLRYLGTPDQLDHIEYQLSLLGVPDEEMDHQRVLGQAIIELVAASPEITPDLLASLEVYASSARSAPYDAANSSSTTFNSDSGNNECPENAKLERIKQSQREQGKEDSDNDACFQNDYQI